MKRSALGPGQKALDRGSTFQRHPADVVVPDFTKRPKRSKRKRSALIDKQASEAWARRARSKVCALCAAANPRGHHVITQQQLRKTAGELGLEFERLRWDTRNLLPLCDRHHAAHHSRRHPVSWLVLVSECPKVFQFARELDLVWWLERTYPNPESEAA